jgi:hypothetical protein
MPETATFDVGRAAAYVRGMTDAVRQVLAADPEPDRPLRIPSDLVIILGGRPIGCGIDPVPRTCWPGVTVSPDGFVTWAELGGALARVVTVAEAIHKTLGGGGVTPDEAREVGLMVEPPPR